MNPLLCLITAVAVTFVPTGIASATEERLDELDLAHVSTGWGKVERGKSVAGLPIVLGGKTYGHGIGVHSPSSMTVALDGKAQTFRAVVGVNDQGGNEVGEVEFRATADGKPLWNSGTIRKGDGGKPVEIGLAGVRRLVLEVDPLGANHSDHAVWADPVIVYSGAKPAITDPNAVCDDPVLYPSADGLIPSPGNTTYYVDPSGGNDSAAGNGQTKPWKSISKINALKLAPGDRVLIAPGAHDATLKPSGAGTAEKPVTIRFAAGRHEFPEATALRRAWFVSNSCDNPTLPRPVGILMENVRHFSIEGVLGKDGVPLSEIVFGGRMIEIVNDRCDHVNWSGIAFDLKRPTVSEFRVEEVRPTEAVIRIAEGSTYQITDGRFAWTGDLGTGGTMVQQAIPGEGRCWRVGIGHNPFANVRATDLGGGRVRLVAREPGALGLEKGRQFQFRNVTRDTVSAHNNRCRDLVFRDCAFHALTGMGIVSQFCENLTYERVHVEPPAGTIRTCPAWADAYHFSGCRGVVRVEGCRFSGLQDDPINIHGTHLRIIGRTAPNQLRLRFMQPQTYGFAAFQAGDEVAVISHAKLRELPGNPRRKVAAVAPDPADASGKLWLLTLDGPVPEFGENDVIDNISWYPDVLIRGCHVAYSSCRGFLLTTRGKAVIEDCVFDRAAMSAILIEDDAEGWFESGPIGDLTIRRNRFIGTGIEINPQTRNTDASEPVHENIRITDNIFNDAGISAKNTRGLVITDNRFTSAKPIINLQPSCADAKVEGNSGNVKP
ncbi:MAG: NPCBM/NEW2 domain-containing protein [Verrucomicrobia bacterium]|nr:NPCBM/NEW2 domain-containing protein [Verrucomicrobiota bacterium]